ncbi:MAG TPA: PAS domain S-box protein, partial [Candidatus Kapabacteria bacterium]|nr:PAS domain S-box protein [Candidatus Kapabacteria bacterium]
MKEKSLKLIADHIADWIYWVDTEGKAMFHSKSVEQFTEYTLEEISANENFLIDIVYDEDKEKYCEHKKIAYTENSETYELEFRIVTKSGKIKTIAHICEPIFEDGKYIGRIADNRDITFQKMQSETILTEKMRFDLYMDSIRDVLWEVDENYFVKYVSPAFEKISGVPCEKVIGKSVLELLDITEGSDLFSYFMDRRKNILGEGIIEDTIFEVPFTSLEGKLIWFEVSSRPMMKNDKLVGFVGIARDITARKNYLTKLETITDTIEKSILEFDIANNTITFNEKFYKMLGYSPDEFENSFENIIEHIHIDDRERVANSIQELISNKSGTFSHEYRMKTKEGSWKWVKCNGKITEWDKKGNPTKIIAAHIDIDKEKRLQEEKLLLLSSA